MDIEKLLTKTIFVGLNEAQLGRILSGAQELEARPGDIIVREHEPGDTLYVILEGRVIITRTAPDGEKVLASLTGDETLSRLYEGDFFGEMALMDIEPRSATVTAAEDCRLLALTSEHLGDLFTSDPDLHIILLANIARILSRRLRKIMTKDD